jgi:hypothetical protein
MLKKEYVRDGKNKIIGSVTSGFVGSYGTLVKDAHEQVVGTTSLSSSRPHHHHSCRAWRNRGEPNQREILQKAADPPARFSPSSLNSLHNGGKDTSQQAMSRNHLRKGLFGGSYNREHTLGGV